MPTLISVSQRDTPLAGDRAHEAQPARSTEPAAGLLRPEPKLLPRRAAAGALLIALASLGVFGAWTRATRAPSTTYVVAVHSLAPGQVVSADDVALSPMVLSDAVASGAYNDVSSVIGTVAVAPISGGDLVQQSAVVDLTRGPVVSDAPPARQISLTLDRSRAVSGLLEAGESVDVLATFGSGTDAWTEQIAAAALVVSISDDSESGLASSDGVVVTLALADDLTVMRAVNATDAGVLTLVRTTGATAPVDGRPEAVTPSPPSGSGTPRDRLGSGAVEGAATIEPDTGS